MIDNEDELELLTALAAGAPRSVPIALRLAPAAAAGARRPASASRRTSSWRSSTATGRPARHRRSRITGVHFHLDGYAAARPRDAR